MSPTQGTTASAGASGLSLRLCRQWVRVYTRHLPIETATARQAEIESDVWEHAADAHAEGVGTVRHQAEVLRRVIAGIPADLSWRRHTRRSARRLNPGGSTMRTGSGSVVETGLITAAAVGIAIGLSLLPLLGSAADGPDLAEVAWFLSATLLAALLGVGLFVRRTHPGVSTGLLVVGSLAPSVAWFWLPPVYLVTLAIVVLALVTSPRRGPLETAATPPGA